MKIRAYLNNLFRTEKRPSGLDQKFEDNEALCETNCV
jgi:hypothetical protein